MFGGNNPRANKTARKSRERIAQQHGAGDRILQRTSRVDCEQMLHAEQQTAGASAMDSSLGRNPRARRQEVHRHVGTTVVHVDGLNCSAVETVCELRGGREPINAQLVTKSPALTAIRWNPRAFPSGGALSTIARLFFMFTESASGA